MIVKKNNNYYISANPISSKTTDWVNVALCTDLGYFWSALIVVHSICENKKPSTRIRFHIFLDRVPSNIWWMFEKFNSDSVEVNLISFVAKNQFFGNYSSKSIYADSTFIRLYLPNFLPDIDKVLYLDTDLFVKGDILSLYRTNIEDTLVAGIRDFGIVISLENNLFPIIDYTKAWPNYFNAGVLLMNLRKMREDNCLDKFSMIYRTNSNRFFFPDQDILNEYCKDSMKLLDYKWNFCIMNFIFKYGDYRDELHSPMKYSQVMHTTKTTFDDLYRDATIVHLAFDKKLSFEYELIRKMYSDYSDKLKEFLNDKCSC